MYQNFSIYECPGYQMCYDKIIKELQNFDDISFVIAYHQLIEYFIAKYGENNIDFIEQDIIQVNKRLIYGCQECTEALQILRNVIDPKIIFYELNYNTPKKEIMIMYKILKTYKTKYYRIKSIMKYLL